MVFKKGHITWNKGTKGIMKPNKTSFKKGGTHTEEWKLIMKNKMKKNKNGFQKGSIPYNKGKVQPKTSGKNHWNWQGGITPLNKLLRAKGFWKMWREAVFLRDNYTCQNPDCECCKNKIGIMLHPHHIKPLAAFPKLAFNINNGITYCAEFHLKSSLHKNIKEAI